MSFNRLSTILVLFLISELTTGTYLAWNFQVSHISTETEFSKKRDLNEWAKTQITSTVDYSHGDVIATFMSGALNYQTVHHLFPAISQYYYPELSGIVQEVCLEYGLTYNVLPSFIDAFKEHIRYLFKMGEMGVKVD